jgi:hypothetical protein
VITLAQAYDRSFLFVYQNTAIFPPKPGLSNIIVTHNEKDDLICHTKSTGSALRFTGDAIDRKNNQR